jgi:hypothetical protein
LPRDDVGRGVRLVAGRSFAAPAADSRVPADQRERHGIGISEEGLERLFQPFTQIDSGLAGSSRAPGWAWRW